MYAGDSKPNHARATGRAAAPTDASPDPALNALEGLVRVIAEGKAVVYVGAGVSQSAGLPSWNELLKKLQAEASGRLNNQPENARKYFQTLKRKSRSLEVGDWLLTLLGPEFQQVISRLLSEGDDLCQMEPSTIHWNLVRLPFTMALTTNYDLLLEMAYERSYRVCPHKLPYLTWKHTEEILRAAHQKPFRIVHVHGTVGDSNSIVLSGSQYTILHNAQPRFGEVLKWLLKTKTFLFVGAGLEDPDLIFHLQEAVAEHGGAVGPHYALLPHNEAPQIRRDILRNSLHIEVIPVEPEPATEMPERQDGTHWLTIRTSDILRDLSGRVAHKRFELALPGFPTSDDPTFCLDHSLRTLLKHAIEFTGSYRGDFCLSPDGVGSHLSGELNYWISEGPTGGAVKGDRVSADSICGIAYYQATAELGVRVGNVNTRNLAQQISATSRLGHYGPILYVRGDHNVKSELAMPIEADGVRIGVLNLESNLLYAYSDEHVTVAKRFAEKAGRLYAAAYERRNRASRLEAHKLQPAEDKMRSVCGQLWRIAHAQTAQAPAPELAFLIYRADYITGQLVSSHPGKERFEFHSPKNKNASLPARVFLDGRPYFYPDIAEANTFGKISDEHVRELGLAKDSSLTQNSARAPDSKASVIGFPVLIHGHIAGVVIAWAKYSDKPLLDGRDIELFRRASHLLANNFNWEDKFRNHLQLDSAFPSIHKSEKILQFVASSNGNARKRRDQGLNKLGERYRAVIGAALLGFLQDLNKQEEQFRDTMPKSGMPNSWISPRRCRCWILAEPSPNDKPQFLLALQVDISAGRDKPPLWKNTYRPKRNGDPDSQPLGIVMQPFERPQDCGLDRPPTQAEGPTTVRVTDFAAPGSDSFEVNSTIFDNNPHLSFLISRVSTYPFAFSQRPRVLGTDIMHEVLEKNPELPWVVAPLIVASETQWQETGKPNEKNATEHTTLDAHKFLAGYLTFDDGPFHKPPAEPAPGKRGPHPPTHNEITGDWADFQNDLLHQISLFAACLAQRPCFERLVRHSHSQVS